MFFEGEQSSEKNITFGINKGDISLNFFTNMESK